MDLSLWGTGRSRRVRGPLILFMYFTIAIIVAVISEQAGDQTQSLLFETKNRSVSCRY